MTLAIADVKLLAKRYCDYPAADHALMVAWSPPLGFAHELGHLLISTGEDRAQPWYGLGEPGSLVDDELADEAPAVEIAASIVHAWIVVATDWFAKSQANRRSLRASISPRQDHIGTLTAPEFFFDPTAWRDARSLLVDRGLRPSNVQSVAALEQTIRRTLETT